MNAPACKFIKAKSPRHKVEALGYYRCPHTVDMFNREGNTTMNIETLIPKAESAYHHAIEAREAALDTCARAGIYLDKAKQAEADAKQLLDLIYQLKEQANHDNA